MEAMWSLRVKTLALPTKVVGPWLSGTLPTLFLREQLSHTAQLRANYHMHSEHLGRLTATQVWAI